MTDNDNTLYMQALSIAIWTFGRMGNASPRVLSVAAEAAQYHLEAFTPQQLARVAWAFAAMGYHPAAVVDGVAKRLQRDSAKFDGKSLANAMWALSR